MSTPSLAWDGGLEIGSVIDLALGERTFVDAESGQEAPCLYDESLYTTESATGDVISEYLANPGEVKSYKVVGFYAPEGIRQDDVWGQRGPGYLGFVSSPDVPVRTTSIYLTTNLKSGTEIDGLIEDYTGFYAPEGIRQDDVWGQRGPGYLGFVSSPDVPVRTTSIYLTTNLKSGTEIDGLIEDYTGDPHIIFNGGGNRGDIENMEGQTAAYSHDSLMRYQGMTDDRSIWGTLYPLAFILSAVVIGASISLIYNSFAIAVSERTRQFGLLSSLGASKRQLRRTVYARLPWVRLFSRCPCAHHEHLPHHEPEEPHRNRRAHRRLYRQPPRHLQRRRQPR